MTGNSLSRLLRQFGYGSQTVSRTDTICLNDMGESSGPEFHVADHRQPTKREHALRTGLRCTESIYEIGCKGGEFV